MAVTDESRARARAEFVDAAYRVIDADGPRPSMDDIARAAGGTKPRLYRQFADKDELYAAIAERMRTDVEQRVMPDFSLGLQPPLISLRHAIAGYAEEIADHPNVFRFLTLGPTKHETNPGTFPLDIGNELARAMVNVATVMFDAILLDTAGVAYAVQAAVGAVVATTDLWLNDTPDGARPDVGRFVDEVSDLVWGLIAAYLHRRKLDIDPDQPLFVSLARAREAGGSG